MNVLFVTLDQFRADCLSAAGHLVVKTPNLDALAARGVRFARHFSQAAPCAPGRASLYTGTYQMNHRVVGNGSALSDGLDNIARAGQRAGYAPVLFGYTDQGIDPKVASGPEDPWLDTYEGVLPGFTVGVHLDERQSAWVEHLRALGYEVASGLEALASESSRPANLSLASFMTTKALEWLEHHSGEWFVHLSYLRPHPPYAAAGGYASMYDPAFSPAPHRVGEGLHPLHEIALTLPGIAAPTDPEAMAALQAQYFGMITEVDAQFGRVLDALDERGDLDDTIVIVSSDHGEQLGDQGLLEKLGFFESSYAIPCIISDPRHPEAHGTVVEHFTENVDVFPTLLELLDLEPSTQADGQSLVPFLTAGEPRAWRTAAHWEWDWRYLLVGEHREGGPINAALETYNVAVLRTETHAYAHFGDGDFRCFDLAADPSWATTTNDPAVILPLAQEMLTWRSTHLGGDYTGFLLGAERQGRWPRDLFSS